MARYSIEVVRAVVEVEPSNEYLLLVDPGTTHAAILELQRQGIRLVAIGLGGFIGRYRERRPGPIVSMLEAPTIGFQLRCLAPDLVHWMGQPPPYVLPGVKSVATLYDLYGYAQATRSSDVASRLNAWQHRRYRAMKAVICISDTTRTTAIAQLNLVAAKCITIPPGFERLDLDPSLSELTADTRRKPFLLHVGILTPRKNPRVLLESFAIVSKRHPELELWCVGPYQVNPDAAETVIRMARSLGIDDRVRLVGDVSDGDLAHLYQACLGFVFPSLAEGFGYPAVEAISNYAPCVLGDIPALHEAAGDLARFANAGDSVAFATAIDELINDSQRWAVGSTFPRRADAWMQRFSRREIGAKLLAVYRAAAHT